MIGSPAIAFWIAHVLFWALVAYGWVSGELSPKRVSVFVLLWLAGRVGLPHVPFSPAAAMFPSFVAVLDIALVFMIFKRDVRLT